MEQMVRLSEQCNDGHPKPRCVNQCRAKTFGREREGNL